MMTNDGHIQGTNSGSRSDYTLMHVASALQAVKVFKAATKDEIQGKNASRWESSELWVQHTQNAYGAFAHVAMQSGLVRSLHMCGPMLFISIMIQAVFSMNLINSHFQDFIHKEICEVPASLQISASVIFITLMFNEIPSMWQSARLVLFASHHYGGDGDTIGELNHEDTVNVEALRMSLPTRLVIFLLSVATELGTWTSILVAGCMWINTSTTVDLVIRSTVSIMFAQNVDELIFESCCPLPIMEDVEETRYCIPNLPLKRLISSKARTLIEYYFGVYVYLLLLTSFSVSSVLALRAFQTGCPGHYFWVDPPAQT